VIVVVDDPERRARGGRSLPAVEGFLFAPPEDLTPGFLDEQRPALVLSWLVDGGFDAIDVACRLAAGGFRGPYRALSAPLPNPDAIRHEVRAAAPGLDFDLLILTAPA
jgi:hypothetical protein